MALIDGSPIGLRNFARLLEADADEIKVVMGTSTILRKRSENPLLRVSLKGDCLTVEGDNHALGGFCQTIMGVADDAESAKDRTIKRHAHIEYLGDGDRWRASDSFPLLITADWPS